MSNKELKHKEIIERYCHVIGKNATISKTYQGEKVQTECLNKHICEQNGGCKNEKFM